MITCGWYQKKTSIQINIQTFLWYQGSNMNLTYSVDLLIWDKLWRINMDLTYVIPDIIKSYLSWRKIQKCFKSTSRTAFKDSNSLDPFVLFALLATVSYTSDSPLQLVSGFTIIAIHWSVSPTPTLVLDKLLFLQILYLILKPSIAAAVKVFNISKITSSISKVSRKHSIQEISWSLLGSGLSSGFRRKFLLLDVVSWSRWNLNLEILTAWKCKC